MSWQRRLLFSLVTALLFAGVIEGSARLLWWRMERGAMERIARRGEEVLRNDTINFMKQVDGTYGYVLRPGFSQGGAHVNDQGFAQRDTVPVARVPGRIRLVAMGESTTQGHDVDRGNYPVYLRDLITRLGKGYAGVEVLNSGVPGWASDQLALRAERELAAYRPDIALLYMGWNDFQFYDPLGPAPRQPYFAQAYGDVQRLVDRSRLRSLSLLSAVYGAAASKLDRARARLGTPAFTAPEMTYRYYLENLDRTVAVYRRHPQTIVAVCTLAARWPHGSREQFDQPAGHVWWMEAHGLGPEEAARALVRFNDLIRGFARSRELLLIDVAREFENLDRERLFWDFAHLHPQGYELLAEIMYEGLRRAGAIQGAESPRREQLRALYQRDTETG